MRNKWTRIMLTIALAAVSMASLAQADQRVDLNLKDAPMKAAIEVLMRQTGMRVVFESSEEPYPEVTLSLPNVTAEDGLRYICQAAGVYFRKDDNGVYVITRNKPAEMPVNAEVLPPAKAKKQLYKIKLQHADPEAVYKLIRYGIPTTGEESMLAFKAFGEKMTLSQRLRALGDTSGVASTYVPGIASPVATNNPGVRTNLESGNGIVLPGEDAPQGGLGAFGGGGQGGLGGGQGQGGLGGGLGQGGQGGGQLQAGGLIDQGITYIVFDPNDNSIVIQATEAQYRELQGYVDQFDVAPKQVTIKVQFVTMSNSVSRSLGYDWLYSRGTMVTGNTPGNFARSTDPIFLGWQSGNIATRLRTRIEDGYGRVVSSPTIRTMNNMPGTVSQGTQTTIYIPVTTGITQGQVQTTYQAIPLPLINTLSVRPRINGDGTITTFLNVGMQQIGNVRTSPDGINAIPDTTLQFLSVATRVKSGETIVLAGFTSKSDQGTLKKFPILGDLPIVGQFFRSTTKENTTSELMIFVTPTIEEDE